MRRPDACSLQSLRAEEPLVGSAPTAVAWLALEQPGPWGAKAFTQSHLDQALGAALEARATAAGVRPVLIRRPGRHADTRTAPRLVLLAHTVPGATWLLHGTVADPAQVLDADLDALAAGDADAVAQSLPGLRHCVEAHLLVCTNGSRDVCCATEGRPVVAAAAAVRPGRVWEVTHTSGHRFAPTTVLLPSGVLHGRVPLDGGARLLDDADVGLLTLAGFRGRSTWPAAGQAAEDAVRAATGERDLDALVVHRDGDAWQVAHRDGRRWRVQVGTEETAAERAESCGKPPLPMRRHVVGSVELLD